jgi:hypothetical protein
LHDGSLEDKRKEQRKFHFEAHWEKRWVALLTPKFRKKKENRKDYDDIFNFKSWVSSGQITNFHRNKVRN